MVVSRHKCATHFILLNNNLLLGPVSVELALNYFPDLLRSTILFFRAVLPVLCSVLPLKQWWPSLMIVSNEPD